MQLLEKDSDVAAIYDQFASFTKPMQVTLKTQTASLLSICKHNPDNAKKFMALAIIDLCDALNVQNTMNARQVEIAISLLLEEYKWFQVHEIADCFNKIKLGHYGKNYNRIDVQTISEALSKYWKERMAVVVSVREEEHKKFIQNSDNFSSENREKLLEILKKIVNKPNAQEKDSDNQSR